MDGGEKRGGGRSKETCQREGGGAEFCARLGPLMSRARAVPRNTEDGGRKRKDWTNEREELAQVRWEKGYVYTAGMRNAGLSLLAGRVERAARGSHGDRRVMITWRERHRIYGEDEFFL